MSATISKKRGTDQKIKRNKTKEIRENTLCQDLTPAECLDQFGFAIVKLYDLSEMENVEKIYFTIP